MLSIGSLFSGIGGLELGLERAIPCAHTAWQVEIDPFCRSILAKHWPETPRHEDVRAVGAGVLSVVDLVCGGFPCQDVSSAGARRGLAGPKSGLWREYARIVGELRPRFVIVENVTSGKKLWLPTVREDLAALGYRTRAFALSAADVGAPHLRRRVFVLATTDPDGIVLRVEPGRGERADGRGAALAGVDGQGGRARHADRDRESTGEVAGLQGVAARASAWSVAPELRGVADGIPARVDRLKALGNAVVPQCAEVIGRIIAEHLASRMAAWNPRFAGAWVK
jgi:DNA (cytosine-5)-methyltransferase 1